jgi:hypothetical protein
MINRCAFCGENKEIGSTTMIGWYCIDCYRINIEESQDAIRAIKARRKSNKQSQAREMK